MKEGWTYKKLGEVTNYPKDRISLSEITADRYVGVENLVKDKGGVDFSINLPNTESAIEYIIDDILIGNIRPYLKKIWMADRHGGASGDVIIVRISTGFKSILRSDYLFKVLSSDKFFDYDNAYTHGAKMPRGDKKAISEYLIPIPPLPTQQSIVSELDKINKLIALKKSQLNDFDTLAQSIFYEMFGDPITNEKGWEVKKLGLMALVKTGPFGSMLHKEDYISNGIPLINPMHMKDYHIVADMDFTITKEKAVELSNYLLQCNDIIFARRGDIGRCAIVSDKEKGYLCGTGCLFVRFVDVVEPNYITYIIRSDSFKRELLSKAKGATMLNLNSTTISDLQIPLPPISLQHQFAERIESIERMKQQVQTAIKELETLLASRMQYWFD